MIKAYSAVLLVGGNKLACPGLISHASALRTILHPLPPQRCFNSPRIVNLGLQINTLEKGRQMELDSRYSQQLMRTRQGILTPVSLISIPSQYVFSLSTSCGLNRFKSAIEL